MKRMVVYTQLSTLRAAVEFGFKGCEAGHNIEKVLSDFDILMKPYKLSDEE